MYKLEEFHQIIKSKSKILPEMTYQEILAKYLRIFCGTDEEITFLKKNSEPLRYNTEYIYKIKQAKLSRKKAIEELGPIFFNALLLEDKFNVNISLTYFDFLWKAIFKYCHTFILDNIEYIDFENIKICNLIDLKDEKFLKEIEPRINFNIFLRNRNTKISDYLLTKIISDMQGNSWCYRKIKFSESQIQKFGNQFPLRLFYWNSSLREYAVEKLYSELKK